MNAIIRLLNLKINNIKNLKAGSIDFLSFEQVKEGNYSFEQADIIGVFGQNGTSKSALIDGGKILKYLLSSISLPLKIKDLIANNENYIQLEATFYYENEKKYLFTYIVTIKNKENIYISREQLMYKECLDDSHFTFKQLFTIDNDENNLLDFITPKENLNKVNLTENVIPQFLILKGKCDAQHKSFIFNDTFAKIIAKSKEFSFLSTFINDMIDYGNNYFYIFDYQRIETDEYQRTFLKMNDNKIIKINFSESGIIENKYEDSLKKYLKIINIVLCKIIPNMTIDYENLGYTLSKEGDESFRYQIVTNKNHQQIPFRLESQGIKKLVLILIDFIKVFNKVSSILMIDEFDSGIFEYLQGVILDLFKTRGMGQLLFTSHNLRALEIIKNNIIFTTNDENNRFLKIVYPHCDNLREKYLRDLYLGNNPHLFEQTDEFDIFMALKDAGDLL